MESFTEPHAAYKIIKLFFYAYSIIEHDEQNALNLESVLFRLICNTSSKQFWVTDFFEENIISIQVLMQLFMYYCVGLSGKFKICIDVFVFLTHVNVFP